MPRKNAGKLNKGGNWGNVYGAGRPRNEVREQYLHGADCGGQWLVQVAAGEPVINIIDESGKILGTRPPDFRERSWAIDSCARYGLGVRFEGEIQAEHSGKVESGHSFDLTKLNQKQLEMLHELSQAASGESE